MPITNYPKSSALIFTFLEDVRRHRINSVSGLNPMLINVDGELIYIYIKNLSPAYMSNENEDIWRIQLPKRPDFEQIKESKRLFVLLGYDHIRRVYTSWDPYKCKPRLNQAESCSMYSRLSLQIRVASNQRIEKVSLQNDDEVICIPASQIAVYLKNVRSYFPEILNTEPTNRTTVLYTQDEESSLETLELAESSTTDEKETTSEELDFELNEYGKLCRISHKLINKLLPMVKDADYPDWAEIIKQVKVAYPSTVTENMNPADWMKLFDETKWKWSDREDVRKSQNEGSKRKTHILRVEFPDGRIVEDNNVSTTYCEFIKYVGPEEVNILDIFHAGVNIVSKELDSKYANYQRDIGDGWFVMTNSTTQNKYEDLLRIINEYGISIKVSLVPLSSAEVSTVPNRVISDRKRKKIRVRFPDGRVIQPSVVFESLLEVVKYAGAERVRSLYINCCGDNLILNDPSPTYADACKPVGGGWLCNTYTDTQRKYDQIKYISKKLELGIEVELV